ncbi:hypothetical protein PC121_g22180 [Phytophthora cactorum]|nr:hypothetical protein PC120_g23772 [Phytophthora cactorum]KAG3044017.1 hypothetical protein PC121_g22180 [Phytophthora cactorum]
MGASTHPADAFGLQATSDLDWTGPTDSILADDHKEWIEGAQVPIKVHDDAHLRTMTTLEEQTLLVYLKGDTELRHPPEFLKATLPVTQRAIIEDFHGHFVDYTLTADIPAGVKWRRRPAHMAILEDLFKASTGTKHYLPMITRLIKDVKRFSFNERHTPTVIFYSKRLARFWEGTTVKVQTSTTTLLDTNRNAARPGTDIFSTAQLTQQYAVWVFGANSLSMVGITLTMADIAQCGVLDVEAPRTEVLDLVDIGYYLIRFNQTGYPDGLRSVTHIDLDGTTVLVRHFQANMQIPCYRCFSARHNNGRYKVSMGNLEAVRNQLQRRYRGKITHYCPAPVSVYAHSDTSSLQSFLTAIQLRAEELATSDTPHADPLATMTEADSAVHSPQQNVAAPEDDSAGNTVIHRRSSNRRPTKPNSTAPAPVDRAEADVTAEVATGDASAPMTSTTPRRHHVLDTHRSRKVGKRLRRQLRRGGQTFEALLNSGASKSIINDGTLDANVELGRKFIPASTTVFETMNGLVTSSGSTMVQLVFPKIKYCYFTSIRGD